MHDHSSSSEASPSHSTPSELDGAAVLQHTVRELALNGPGRPHWVPEMGGDSVPIQAIEEADCRALQHAPTPASCITGVTNRSNGAPQHGSTHEHTYAPGGRGPDEYLDSLRADTLKISAKVDRDKIDDLQQHLTEQKRRAQQDGSPVVEAPDEVTLTVADHSPNDNRRVLMEGDGMEVTAVAQPNVPWISFEFGAVWCWNRSPAELVEWARDFCQMYGIEITGTLVSRLDLCVDVDERFYASDAQRFSGNHGGGMSVDYDRKDRPKMIYYQRTQSRPLTWRIYNKRREVEDNDREFWKNVWDAHNVDEGPLWRVEFEAKRPALQGLGSDSWADLTADRMESLWAYSTQQFATMDRKVWDRIQQASTQDPAERAEVGPSFNPDRLTKMGAGCIRRIADELDVPVEAVAEAMAEEAKRPDDD